MPKAMFFNRFNGFYIKEIYRILTTDYFKDFPIQPP